MFLLLLKIETNEKRKMKRQLARWLRHVESMIRSCRKRIIIMIIIKKKPDIHVNESLARVNRNSTVSIPLRLRLSPLLSSELSLLLRFFFFFFHFFKNSFQVPILAFFQNPFSSIPTRIIPFLDQSTLIHFRYVFWKPFLFFLTHNTQEPVHSWRTAGVLVLLINWVSFLFPLNQL